MSPPKRLPTVDRDACPPKSATPPRGYPTGPELAVPHEVPDEITGTYHGEELRTWRERRPASERLQRLEDFKDEAGQRLTRIETHVENIDRMLTEDREERRLERHERLQTQTTAAGVEKVRINSRARVVVAIVGAVTAIVTALGTLAATGKL